MGSKVLFAAMLAGGRGGTFSASGAVIQVDANGDGVFETSTTATVAQLQALL